MIYPTTEYAYVDENGQSVDSTRFIQHIYTDNNDQSSPHLVYDNNSYDNHQQQQVQYRPIVINGSQPLAKCSVLYLGTAISSPGQRGIDAIQEPLSRRYPVDGKEIVRGIEAWLSIYDNGLQLQFARDPSVVLFYPIRSLIYCASIRFATRTQTGAEFPNGWRFVPLDSPAAARVENTRNPPLFAATFRRTRHLPVDECHCFVTKTRQAALALVQACFSAYQATTPQQDCLKVPLYFKVDDYGSKNKEIDSEIRIIPAPDRERMLDYQTNTEGAGFFYKTDRVPIDTWQLWEHHKHDLDRSTSKTCFSRSKSRSYSSSPSRSLSSSSSSTCSSSTSSSCSSCRHNRRNRRRRLASIASIPAIQQAPLPPPSQQQQQQQQQQLQTFPEPDTQSFTGNTAASILTTSASIQQETQPTIDPYAPAPNLIRVERIKDVNSGQDVFIRWVSDINPSMTDNGQQQTSVPHQIYSKNPPMTYQHHYQQQELDRERPNALERLVFDDENLRRSVFYDDRPASIVSNYEKKRLKKRDKHRDSNPPPIEYEIVSGFYEDRHGKRRSIKLDHSQIKSVKDYRHISNDIVHSSAPQNDRRHRNKSFIQPPISESQPHTFSPSIVPLPNSPFIRPFGTAFLPRSSPFYPSSPFNTTSLFSQPNYFSRPTFSRPPFWYRPM